MFKYVILAVTGLFLTACAEGLPEAPAPFLPEPEVMTNPELCSRLADEQRKLEAWIAYGNLYASIAGVDLNEKIEDFTDNIDVFKDIEKARNIYCVVDK